MKTSPSVLANLAKTHQNAQIMTLGNPMAWVYAFSYSSVFWMMFAVLIYTLTHQSLLG